MKEEFLTLYHGTPGSRARDIISTGRISCRATSMMKVYDELKTTPGFVYLTINPSVAVYYGNMLAVVHREEVFSIYQLTIATSDLETDYDELCMRFSFQQGQTCSLAESLNTTQCCRISRDLLLGREVTHQVEFASNISRERSPLVNQLLALRRRPDLEDAKNLSGQLAWQSIEGHPEKRGR